MKKIYIMLTVFILWCNYSNAQCDTLIISTYPPAANGAGQPFPPQNFNPEDSNKRNTLNWMLSTPFPHDLNNASYNGVTMDNPYYQNNTNIGYVAQPKDFHPEDGWEIIHRGFGLLSNYQSMTTNRHEIPFLILYNRFEETIRVFGCSPLGGYDVVAARLSFITSDNSTDPTYQNHEYSALFSPSSGLTQPLDQKTGVTSVLSPAQKHPNLPNRWFHADFKVAYDFCQCDFVSAIKVEFVNTDVSNISLYGRIQATSTPLDLVSKNGSTNPAAFDPNFLSSTDFTTGNATSGVLTYKNFDKLMDDYDAKLIAYNNDKKDADAIKTLSTILTVGAYIATAGKAAFIKPALASIMNLAVKSTKVAYAADGLIYGMKAAGKYTDYYSQRMKSEAKTPSMPSVIQGEMRIEGTLTDDDVIDATIIGTPGSKNTNNLNEEDWPVYPFYNEHLGLFNMVETPKIKLRRDFNTNTTFEFIPPPAGGPMQVSRHAPTNKLTFKIDDPLKYVFNPATKPDLEATKVLFSIEFETLPLEFDLYDIDSKINMERKYNVDDSDIMKFRTPFLPAECLEDFISEISISSDDTRYRSLTYTENLSDFINDSKVFLKALVVFVSEDLDKQSNQNISAQIYKFPVDLDVVPVNYRSLFVDGKNTADITMPFDAPSGLVFSNQTFTSSQDLYSFGTVKIDGVLKANAGVTVNIYADQGFEMSPGSKLEGPGTINLKIFDPSFTCGTPSQPLTVDQNLRDTYCKGTSAKYQANILKSDIQQYQKVKMEEESKYQFTLYPNPTKNVAFVRFELEEYSNVELVITDITGKEIAKDISTLSVGEHGKKLDLSQFSAGVYFVNITINGNRNTERLVVVK